MDIAAIIGEHTTLRPDGTRLTANCPLPGHDDSSQSLVLDPERGSWRCFGCNRGGDGVRFLRMMNGWTMEQATRYIESNVPE